MSFRGVDVRETGDRLLFRAFLQDGASARLATGTTNLRLYELVNDGTLKSYDFNDNTFKTTALTTNVLAMTHRTGNNGTFNTGLWTVALTTLTGFTVGNIYFALVSNTTAQPPDQMREFQFGSGQEDVTILGTVNDAGATTTDFDGNSGLSASNDFYNDGVLVFLNGSLKGLARQISDYVGASRNLQFNGAAGEADAAWPSAPANGDAFAIVGRSGG